MKCAKAGVKRLIGQNSRPFFFTRPSKCFFFTPEPKANKKKNTTSAFINVTILSLHDCSFSRTVCPPDYKSDYRTTRTPPPFSLTLIDCLFDVIVLSCLLPRAKHYAFSTDPPPPKKNSNRNTSSSKIIESPALTHSFPYQEKKKIYIYIPGELNTQAGAGDKFSTALSLECSRGLIEGNFLEIDTPDCTVSFKRSWPTRAPTLERRREGKLSLWLAVVNTLRLIILRVGYLVSRVTEGNQSDQRKFEGGKKIPQ